MKKIILVGICLVLIGCSPSESAIQTAIAQTQLANPTATTQATFTPEPTSTPTSTPTPTEPPTATITPSPTPDLRVVDVNPMEILLQKNELPAEGQYFLPEGAFWESPNSELLEEWTKEHYMTLAEKEEYLQKTNRIVGWGVTYRRGNGLMQYPEYYANNMALHTTAEGAQYAAKNYLFKFFTSSEYEEFTDLPKIGDLTRAVKETRMMADGSSGWTYILVVFTYRNIYCEVSTHYTHDTGSLDDAISVAWTLYNRLLTLPLSTTVTYKP